MDSISAYLSWDWSPAGFGCINARLPDFRDVDHAFDMQPEACLMGLSFDEIVGQPCLTEPTKPSPTKSSVH